jgi:hypothetical protein
MHAAQTVSTFRARTMAPAGHASRRSHRPCACGYTMQTMQTMHSMHVLHPSCREIGGKDLHNNGGA